MCAERELLGQMQGAGVSKGLGVLAGERDYKQSSHLRGPLGSRCTDGGYKVQSRDGAQRGKEGVSGGLGGALEILMPNRNRGSR